MMNRINWCRKQKGGLSLVEPNLDLANAYLKKAEEALESMRINIIKDWKISTAYYTVYFSLYAILMKIGVKCEIHSCTIEFMEQYLNDYFIYEEVLFVKHSLKARIDSQYYVDRSIPDKQYDEMLKKAPYFLIKCKDIILKLKEKKINEIRKILVN